MNKKTFKLFSNQDLSSRKILITGVARGLGKELAKYLANQGHVVFGTVRDRNGFEDEKNLRYIELDLEDPNSINQAVDTLFSETDNLDIVIHNSGIAYLNPADELSDRERRHTFEVNFFGPLILTEKILPNFRKNHSGKIVFISSIASIDPWPCLGIYSASKSAIESVAFEWAVLLKKWGIFVSIIRANPLPTNMKILKSENSFSSVYGEVFSNELIWEKVEDVCERVQEIILSDSPKFQYTSGKASEKTISSLINQQAYEKLILKYSNLIFHENPE